MDFLVLYGGLLLLPVGLLIFSGTRFGKKWLKKED